MGFTIGQESHPVTVHKLKFLQIQSYARELQIAMEELVEFRHIPFRDATAESENGTTFSLGSGDFQHIYGNCALLVPLQSIEFTRVT